MEANIHSAQTKIVDATFEVLKSQMRWNTPSFPISEFLGVTAVVSISTATRGEISLEVLLLDDDTRS